MKPDEEKEYTKNNTRSTNIVQKNGNMQCNVYTDL